MSFFGSVMASPHLGTFRVIASDNPWGYDNYGAKDHGAALWPDATPRLEMFARRARPGWACWGNEVPKDKLVPVFGELVGGQWDPKAWEGGA